ncbi:MAG TPA: HEPN domain-containing protein [Anaerolineae bacterium]
MSAQPKHPVETPREWLRYAEQDFGVAEREMQRDVPAYHTICFLCQSAAEKLTLIGSTLSSRYRLDAELGHAGMGVV